MEDVDSQKAAGELTAVTREIKEVRGRLEAGLRGAGENAMSVPGDSAVRAAEAVDTLHSHLTEWFNFFNGYDPLFTWWMGLPFKHVDTRFGTTRPSCAKRWRHRVGEKVTIGTAPPDCRGAGTKIFHRPGSSRAHRAAAGRDDRHRPSVPRRQRWRAWRATAAAAPSFYQGWLNALKTLDFDKLSRNAQVDYLYIKRTSEVQIARAKTPPQKRHPAQER